MGPGRPLPWALEGPLEAPLPWALKCPRPWWDPSHGPGRGPSLRPWRTPLPWALWGPLQIHKKPYVHAPSENASFVYKTSDFATAEASNNHTNMMLMLPELQKPKLQLAQMCSITLRFTSDLCQKPCRVPGFPKAEYPKPLTLASAYILDVYIYIHIYIYIYTYTHTYI